VTRSPRHAIRPKSRQQPEVGKKPDRRRNIIVLSIVGAAVVIFLLFHRTTEQRVSGPGAAHPTQSTGNPADLTADVWISRARQVDALFHRVFTPCWEGAYGAIGDAHLFDITHDRSLLRFYTVEHPLPGMCAGTWVDDRAWVCLAEMYWWRFTGKRSMVWVTDAMGRYREARQEGRLSHHEGFWSWYNWPQHTTGRGNVFTNSNMNQMASVACWLFEATHDTSFLNDAILVWDGDAKFPGVEKTLYRGNGLWEGKPGLAAFGKQVPWDGAGYCSIGASLYRATGKERYRRVVIETARRIMDPVNGWVDPTDYYQLHMDGNGAFVNFILDAYQIAPQELKDIPGKVGRMLQHVWTNAYGRARVTLHRESDDGIRNGWNPVGGEDGYGVDEVGTVHAQGEAARAFGVYAYVLHEFGKESLSDSASTVPAQ
jgi:hypothetical protein